uniref:Uncharacterized protein n=1 Tax=Siphoviridae sp. ctOCb13 TaxID=2825477 RepID=A0A8S5Q051_9CAUD|nr:MAG TPA: hypothetical protein [Siphoviridae sp. ctOCb13]
MLYKADPTLCADLPNIEQSLLLIRGGDFDAN